MKQFIATLAAVTFSTMAHADISVTFIEGAPKDRFTIENAGGCVLDGATMTIDLGASQAGLIFDTTSKGAGVEVFQPFELVAGVDFIQSKPAVRDGDKSVDLLLRDLPRQESIAFTVDVDDTMGGREITVSNTEIEGAVVRLNKAGETFRAEFGQNAQAILDVC